MCSHPSCDLIATDVDHVTPHRGDNRLRLDPDNLQSLCHGHHSRKTVAQDGGLGHARVVEAQKIAAYYERHMGDLWQGLDSQDEEPSV